MKVDVPEPMNRMFIERESKEDAVKKSFERRKRVTENVPPTNPCQQNTCKNPSQQNCMFPICINWCTVNVRISAQLKISALSRISAPPKGRKI